MKKPNIKIVVIKEDTGYSASALIKDNFIATEAETFEELKTNVLEAVNLAFEDKDFTYTINEIKFEYDLESFFDFYKVINAKALSERIGMNQSLLAFIHFFTLILLKICFCLVKQLDVIQT